MADQLTVCGFDTSPTSTGLSTVVGGPLGGDPEFRTLKPPAGLRAWARMEWVIAELGAYVKAADPDLIVMEGPSLHSTGAFWHENAGLWWEVTLRIRRSGRPLAIIAPTVLKKWATGRGNADKTAMCVAAATRFRLMEIGPDEADALFLASAGLQHYGMPAVKMPATQVEYLESRGKGGKPVIDWPVLQSAPAALVAP